MRTIGYLVIGSGIGAASMLIAAWAIKHRLPEGNELAFGIIFALAALLPFRRLAR